MQKITSTCTTVGYLVMGPIDNNVYFIDDGTGWIVVDPTCDADRIVDSLEGRPVDAIVITHGHWDHTGAAAALREATGAEVISSAVEEPYIDGRQSFGGHTMHGVACPVDRTVNDGDVLEIGNVKMQVIATPGHTPGGMCLFVDSADSQRGAPVLISGDTLFAGTHGRVDFRESDPVAMRESLVRLATLPEDTVVFPGHNDFSTIGREKAWLSRL